VLLARTVRVIPIAAAWLLPVRVIVRNQPFVSPTRVLPQGRRSADEGHPATLADQNVPGIVRKAPPLLVNPLCCL
jgi:hypothetical protein